MKKVSQFQQRPSAVLLALEGLNNLQRAQRSINQPDSTKNDARFTEILNLNREGDMSENQITSSSYNALIPTFHN